MEINEALRLLGIKEGEGGEALQKRYHERLHLFHPDVRGEGEGTRQTQLLNEAYALLKEAWREKGSWGQSVSSPKRQAGSPLQKAHTKKARAPLGHWTAKENPQAYLPRKIFMADDLFGERIVVDTRYQGRYYWHREAEPFPLFLKSVNESAQQLSLLGTRPVTLQPKLFHLLLQEFIHPLDTLKAFAPRETPVPGEGRAGEEAYQLPCHLLPCPGAPRPGLGQSYPLTVRDNRIFCLGADQVPLAQITFLEDALYYAVTPLLIQGTVKGSLYPLPQKARITLTPTGKPYQDPTRAINREIERLLNACGPRR